MTDDDLPDETRLTRTKSRWAELGKFLTGQRSQPGVARLPPGQHQVKNWPVLDLGQTPSVTAQAWRLDIGGAVDTPVTWIWQDLLALPQASEVSDIHCVTTWSRYDNHWQGVSTRELLNVVGVRPEAAFVVLSCSDGYTTNLPLADFAADGALLVHSWEGEPLSPEHGGPVRLVVPHLYFWTSAKWLRRIEFSTTDHPGFWEVRGYHNRGDPWAEERYD